MSSPTPPDSALVQAARRRDPAAWEALVERYDRLIRAVCRSHRLADADADDVRQTTWLKAVEHMDRLHDPRRVGAWIATVARHECLRVLRHGARVRPCHDEVLHRVPDPSAAPDARLLASERRAAVRSALTSLPEDDRTLLGVLFAEADTSYADVGRALRMPIGSIGPTRGRVLERLRRREPLAHLMAAA